MNDRVKTFLVIVALAAIALIAFVVGMAANS